MLDENKARERMRMGDDARMFVESDVFRRVEEMVKVDSFRGIISTDYDNALEREKHYCRIKSFLELKKHLQDLINDGKIAAKSIRKDTDK